MKGPWHELPADWLEWHDVLSVPWRRLGDHIGVCESRARVLALQWRMREPSQLRRVFLHLLDSQCNLAMVCKGRTSSRRMAHNLRRGAAILLASSARELSCYISSEANPADRASRDKKCWGRFRSEQRVAKRARTDPRGRSPPEP